jgi:hypothetical protein
LIAEFLYLFPYSKSAKKIVSDFTPVFNEIDEWNQFETLVHFILSINKLLSQLDQSFTVNSLFGSTLVGLFQNKLGSNEYLSTDELLRTSVDFQRVSRYYSSHLLASFSTMIPKQLSLSYLFFFLKPQSEFTIHFEIKIWQFL